MIPQSSAAALLSDQMPDVWFMIIVCFSAFSPRWPCWRPDSRRCSSCAAAEEGSSSRRRCGCLRRWRAAAPGCERPGTRRRSSTASWARTRSGSGWEWDNSAGFQPLSENDAGALLQPPPDTHCGRNTREQRERNHNSEDQLEIYFSNTMKYNKKKCHSKMWLNNIYYTKIILLLYYSLFYIHNKAVIDYFLLTGWSS